MWNATKDSGLENIDNYVSAIETAKEDLSKINEEIRKAQSHKEEILSGNHILLNEKRGAIEEKLDEARKLREEANAIHSKNTILQSELEDKHKSVGIKEEEVLNSKCVHEDTVKNKEKYFAVKEEDIKHLLLKVEEKNKECQENIRKNEELIKEITDQKKSCQESIDESLSIKKSLQGDLEAVNARIADSRSLRAEAESLKEGAENKILVAQQYLDESRKNKRDSEANLSALLKEKESLNDLIIESKKSKMDSIRLIESSQKNVVEANQKIAELKELKEAMAKQEK